MKLKRPAQRPVPETIVALIDVVFFLLVFFMLIGRMDATSPFDVTPPVATTGADMPAGGATLSIGADGAMALNGLLVSETELLDQLDIILTETPDTLIRVNAHRDTELNAVLPVVARIEATGARDIVLVVTTGGT